jgi:S1-C subfamily serine protease
MPRSLDGNEFMGTTVFDRVKKATVALAVLHEESPPQPPGQQPFTIVGSGFCVDPRGVVVTCAHVIEAFMEKNIKEQLASIPEHEQRKSAQVIPDVRTLVPHALFYVPQPESLKIVVACARIDTCVAKTDMDLGVVRLQPHGGFPSGYPVLDIEEFDSVHEGLEVGTCGFPLGNVLFEQLGTVTSSFSRGIVSSIIPAAGIGRKHVTGFQLDIRATHGNSGGPVISWSNARVFGVLQGGVSDDYGAFLFSHAESLYRLLDDGLVEDILNAQRPTGF